MVLYTGKWQTARHKYITRQVHDRSINRETGRQADARYLFGSPWSYEIINSAAYKDGAAGQKRTEKIKKYSTERLPGEESFKVVPLVYGHYGRWGRNVFTTTI